MADSNWYPSHAQLDSPQKLEMAFRETLRRMYALHDRVGDLHSRVGTITAGTKASQVPPANAAVTNLLGLPVEPSDTTQLADGTKLTYVAATRSFKFLP